MGKRRKTRCLGILTSGGDCQGLNAAIRAVAKTAMNLGIDVVGVRDGFRGLVEGRAMRMSGDDVSGILTLGGTILGTSRDKPHKMQVGEEVLDLTAQAVQNYHKLHLDCLVCLGGGGTQKNALRLMRADETLRVITLPKTIDNDVAGTDVTFGFDTAVQVATEAIDRLHSTASSHQRIMAVEIMGHNAGWLTAAAGLAGGADVVLIPEIPYSMAKVAHDVIERSRKGKRFSIVAVAEGARAIEKVGSGSDKTAKEKNGGKKAKRGGKKATDGSTSQSLSARMTAELEARTGFQARLTTLGYTQRGGAPTAFDRILATNLGAKAAELAAQGVSGVMIAVRGETLEPVKLEKVAGNRKTMPPDHPILESLRAVGVSLGVP